MLSREALAAALAYFDEGEPDGYVELEAVLAAARERLAQLPETCGTCGGSGRFWIAEQAEKGVCPTCHGRGTVYPPALVERIDRAIHAWNWDHESLENQTLAVAVLDALNVEVSE